MSVPQYSSMNVIPDGRIQGTQVSQCFNMPVKCSNMPVIPEGRIHGAQVS